MMRIEKRLLMAVLALGSAYLAGCGGESSAPLGPSGQGDARLEVPPPSLEVSVVDTPLLKARQDLDSSFLGRQGVAGTGIGVDAEGNEHLVLLVEDDAAMAAAPSMIGSVRVETLVTGRATAFAVYPGRSTGNDRECAAGTLGAAVTRNGSGGGVWWLSNNHVFARSNLAALGESVDYPGRYDADCGHPPVIGTLSAFERIQFNGSANRIDAAIALMRPGTAWSPTINGDGHSYRPTNNVQPPQVGISIKKIGRTTGYTEGTVVLRGVSVWVWYDNGVALFSGQMITTPGFSAAGDSGSLVVTKPGNNPVGLLFSGFGDGSAVLNPIQPVLDRFNIRFLN